ncbi:MAG TPA: substrate-binding domain-containing protein [Parasegetibacter sp.]
MKRISIKDIARAAGVSPTTVSFVLNGKSEEKRISNEVAEKIRKIAAELKFNPNQVARGLRTGKTHTIGLIIEDIANNFFASVARVVEEEAYKNGYKVVYCSTGNNPDKARELLHMLKQRQVDGFIITPTKGMETEIETLKNEKRPIVLLDRFIPSIDTSYVMVDNFKGSYEITTQLIQSGYRNIGYVSLKDEMIQMEEREMGYVKALEDAGISWDKRLIKKIAFDISKEDQMKELSSFFSNTPELDSVYFATNYLGIAGLECLKKLNKTIPDDLAVVSFDDNDLFRLYNPGISVVSQPIQEIGMRAIRILFDEMSGKISKPLQVRLDPTLIQRESAPVRV